MMFEHRNVQISDQHKHTEKYVLPRDTFWIEYIW